MAPWQEIVTHIKKTKNVTVNEAALKTVLPVTADLTVMTGTEMLVLESSAP